MSARMNVQETDGGATKQLFRDLDGSEANPEITEIESLCLQCGLNGITKVLLTKIPFYKEVVIMSFFCENCNWENNELQPASTFQEKGVQFKLRVETEQDLGRQVIRTRWASVTIPELDFEIPSQTQEGSITTLEGILDRTCTGLSSKLDELKLEESNDAEKINLFLKKFRKLKDESVPFNFVLRDCTGNSFIENLCAPKADPQLEITHFERSREENLMLGIYSEDVDPHPESSVSETGPDNLKDEVLGFATNCYSCNAPCVTNMKITQVPHFKEVVIMATTCDLCGHNTNEVKSGSGIEPLGIKITLHITEAKDLTRDLLKSDTCSISIPEIELEVGPSALRSCYTTVEGILTNIKSMLQQSYPLCSGDSANPHMKKKMDSFMTELDEVISGRMKSTLILDDPCGNSYVQSIYYPNSDDNLTMEHYQRTAQQDDELGITDMKVENYEKS